MAEVTTFGGHIALARVKFMASNGLIARMIEKPYMYVHKLIRCEFAPTRSDWREICIALELNWAPEYDLLKANFCGMRLTKRYRKDSKFV